MTGGLEALGIDAGAVRDFFRERAAFLEFDGGAPRNKAIRRALAETASEFGITVDQAARCAFLNDAVLQALEAATP
jgi:hypothetical protein